MIAEYTQFDLPDLTEGAAHIVHAFLSTNEPIDRLAEALGLHLVDLLRILTDPAVQAHIQAATALAEAKADLRVAEARAHAVQVLQSIAIDDSADTTERRRAATAIMRRRAVPAICTQIGAPRSPPRRHDESLEQNNQTDPPVASGATAPSASEGVEENTPNETPTHDRAPDQTVPLTCTQVSAPHHAWDDPGAHESILAQAARRAPDADSPSLSPDPLDSS